MADTVTVSGPVNRRSHVPRLGLARALSRSAHTQDQAQQLYQEVISMAPEVSWHLLQLHFRQLTIKGTVTQACQWCNVDFGALYVLTSVEGFHALCIFHGAV